MLPWSKRYALLDLGVSFPLQRCYFTEMCPNKCPFQMILPYKIVFFALETVNPCAWCVILGYCFSGTRLYSRILPHEGGPLSGLILVFHIEMSSVGYPPSGLPIKYWSFSVGEDFCTKELPHKTLFPYLGAPPWEDIVLHGLFPSAGFPYWKQDCLMNRATHLWLNEHQSV